MIVAIYHPRVQCVWLVYVAGLGVTLDRTALERLIRPAKTTIPPYILRTRFDNGAPYHGPPPASLLSTNPTTVETFLLRVTAMR